MLSKLNFVTRKRFLLDTHFLEAFPESQAHHETYVLDNEGFFDIFFDQILVLVSCPPQPSFVPCPPLRTPSPIPCPPLLSSSVLRSRPRHPLPSSIPVLHHHPITRRPLTNPDSCLPHWVYLLIMEHYPGGADHGA